jgi:RNA polymerase sigma-70 factor (ECF subfamily)
LRKKINHSLQKEATLAIRESLEIDQVELERQKLIPPRADDVIAPASPSDLSPTAPDDNESVLVAQARQDPTSFGVLYERYVERVYAYIYHRVGNIQDTEDLTARTFYRALDKLHTYEDRGLPFSAWLFRIAHNLVANWHRDRGRRRFLSLDRLWSHSKEGDTPEEHLEQAETQAALWTAINRLPKERRDLLLYKFSSRLSNVEIGEMMNKSEGAIKSLYFRTLSALRKDLEAMGWGGPATPDPQGEGEVHDPLA